jgi:hypothetical protein
MNLDLVFTGLNRCIKLEFTPDSSQLVSLSDVNLSHRDLQTTIPNNQSSLMINQLKGLAPKG